MARRNQSWSIGDIFTVRLNNGQFVLGQIVGREAKVLNSATVAFYDYRFDAEDEAKKVGSLQREKAFSVVFSTRESLDSGDWHVVENREVGVSIEDMPYEHLRSSGYVGAKVVGSGILDEFLNAYYGLAPWDDWKDPQYLDRLLLSPSKKPSNLVFKHRLT